ncbi:MAG: glutamate 5-kinase [Desulfococcus sp. 4484_241]|nr:MAG: glutamate 5-kinase [Desulfococcus sp. 4484_241]
MKNDDRQSCFARAKRVVIKAGSGVLTGKDGLNLPAIRSISKGITALTDRGLEVIYVSSGAMACGMKKVGLAKRPLELPKCQAIAAIGQAGLIMEYEKAFARYGRQVAQVLLTNEDLSNRKRYLNARNTLYTLLAWDVVPIINENDTVAVDEIKFGDNDNLAAMVAMMMDADLLVNLTDTDGLYDKDPRTCDEARMIPSVHKITREMEKTASRLPGAVGTGGMSSKVMAARKATCCGIPVVIANGLKKNVLTDLFDGKPLGTFFHPNAQKLCSRKRWIAYSLKAAGSITVDAGAAMAIKKKGKSLLPGGIKTVSGNFSQGAPVDIISETGELIATGLVNYSAADIKKIMGQKTSMIPKLLGGKPYDEVVHRNNMVIMS